MVLGVSCHRRMDRLPVTAGFGSQRYIRCPSARNRMTKAANLIATFAQGRGTLYTFSSAGRIIENRFKELN